MRRIQMNWRYAYVVAAALVLIESAEILRDLDLRLRVGSTSYRLAEAREDLREQAKALQAYHKAKGSYPSNDEFMVDGIELGFGYSWDMDILPLLLGQGQVLRPMWGGPVIYENRRGIDPSKWTDSPVNQDTKRIYSLRVDDGIYLWCPTAKEKHESYPVLHLRILGIQAAFYLGALLFFGLFVVSSIRAGRQRSAHHTSAASAVLKGFMLGAIIVLAYAIVQPIIVTCYKVSSGHRHVTKESLQAHLRLVERYHSRGIVNDETYEKIMGTVRKYSDVYDRWLR